MDDKGDCGAPAKTASSLLKYAAVPAKGSREPFSLHSWHAPCDEQVLSGDLANLGAGCE